MTSQPHRWPEAVRLRAMELRRVPIPLHEVVAILAAENGGEGPRRSTVSQWMAATRAEHGFDPVVVAGLTPPRAELGVERLDGETQRAWALRVSSRQRTAVKEIRSWIARDPDRLAAVLLDPPPALEGLAVLDVVLLARSHRSAGRLDWLGRRALVDRINLLLPLGRASETTRRWAARHGGRGLRSGKGLDDQGGRHE